MRLIDRLLRRDPDADLSDELRFHLEMEAKKLRDTGLAPDAARREARRRLGGVDKYTEELRDVRGGRGNLRFRCGSFGLFTRRAGLTSMIFRRARNL